jgi:hypothetical protein
MILAINVTCARIACVQSICMVLSVFVTRSRILWPFGPVGSTGASVTAGSMQWSNAQRSKIKVFIKI